MLYPQPLKAPTWIAFPLDSLTLNYGAPYQVCQYYKDPFGFVHLRGLCKGNSGTGFLVGTLPTGYKPITNHMFCAIDYYTAQPDNLVFRLEITTNGFVQVIGTNDVQPHNDFCSISGITFCAAT